MGSYLFCVNKNNSWAPPNERGFWLEGKLWILNVRKYNAHSALEIRFENTRNRRAAIYPTSNAIHTTSENTQHNTACAILIDACTKSFGSNFSHIGAAGYSLAITD